MPVRLQTGPGDGGWGESLMGMFSYSIQDIGCLFILIYIYVHIYMYIYTNIVNIYIYIYVRIYHSNMHSIMLGSLNFEVFNPSVAW